MLRVHFIGRADGSIRSKTILLFDFDIDCKTVRIFAYSSTREQSNKRSGTRLKTESETGESVRLARFARVRLLRHSLPISLLILRKNRPFCSLTFTHINKAHYTGGLRTPFLP